MALNELTPGLQDKVAPTDCRLRPDQHYMEVGEFDKVSCSKALKAWQEVSYRFAQTSNAGSVIHVFAGSTREPETSSQTQLRFM